MKIVWKLVDHPWSMNMNDWINENGWKRRKERMNQVVHIDDWRSREPTYECLRSTVYLRQVQQQVGGVLEPVLWASLRSEHLDRHPQEVLADDDARAGRPRGRGPRPAALVRNAVRDGAEQPQELVRERRAAGYHRVRQHRHQLPGGGRLESRRGRERGHGQRPGLVVADAALRSRHALGRRRVGRAGAGFRRRAWLGLFGWSGGRWWWWRCPGLRVEAEKNVPHVGGRLVLLVLALRWGTCRRREPFGRGGLLQLVRGGLGLSRKNTINAEKIFEETWANHGEPASNWEVRS